MAGSPSEKVAGIVLSHLSEDFLVFPHQALAYYHKILPPDINLNNPPQIR
jgi:hypothetical protein